MEFRLIDNKKSILLIFNNNCTKHKHMFVTDMFKNLHTCRQNPGPLIVFRLIIGNQVPTDLQTTRRKRTIIVEDAQRLTLTYHRKSNRPSDYKTKENLS